MAEGVAADNDLLAALVARGTSYCLTDTAIARATIPRDRLYRLGDELLPAARRMPDLSLNAGRQATLHLFPEFGEPVAPRTPKAPKARPRSTGGLLRHDTADAAVEQIGRSFLGTGRVGEAARPGSRTGAIEPESSDDSVDGMLTTQQLVDPRDLVDVPAPRLRLGVDRSFKTLVNVPNNQTTPYTPSPLADVSAYQRLVDAAKRFDVELNLKGTKRALVYHNLVAVGLRQQKSKYPMMSGLRKWPDTLGFDSRFEAGNLFSAARYLGTNVYELLLNPDFDTCDHTGWFYFCMGNVRAGVRYTFKIRNFIKEHSIYEKGMRIACLRGSTRDTVGWHAVGENVCYYGNNLPRKGDYFYKEVQDYYVNTAVEEDSSKKTSTTRRAASAASAATAGIGAKAKPKPKPKKKQTSKNVHDVSGSYFTLSFDLEFDSDEDEVFLAASMPYTYSDLNRYLANLKPRPGVVVERLCKTIYENNCPVVKITSGAGPNAYAGKDVMLVVGREHPGDHTASWCVQGLLDWFSGRRDAEIMEMMTGRARQPGAAPGLLASSAFSGASMLSSAASTPMAGATQSVVATPTGPMTPSMRLGRSRSRQRFGQRGRPGADLTATRTASAPPPSLPDYPLPHTPLPAPLEWTHDSRHDIKQDLYQGQLLRSFLLERYVIIVVPMLSIDGVLLGNTRTDTSAQAIAPPEKLSSATAAATADSSACGIAAAAAASVGANAQTAEARAAALAKTLDPNRGNPRPIDLHRAWESCTGLSAPTVYATKQLLTSFLERKGCRAAAVLNVEACGGNAHHSLYATETAPHSELKELFWRVCGRQGVIPNLPLPALADFLAASKDTRQAAPDGTLASARGRVVMFNASNIVLGASEGPTLSQLVSKSKARASDAAPPPAEPERRSRSQGQDRSAVDKSQAIQAAIFGTTSVETLLKPEPDPDALYYEFAVAFKAYCGADQETGRDVARGTQPPTSASEDVSTRSPPAGTSELNVTPHRPDLFREYILPTMLDRACSDIHWRARLGFSPASTPSEATAEAQQTQQDLGLSGVSKPRPVPTSSLAGVVFEATPRGDQGLSHSFQQTGVSVLSTSCLIADPPSGRIQEGNNPFSYQGCRYAHLAKSGTLLSQVLDGGSRPAALATTGSLGRQSMYCPTSYTVAMSPLHFSTQGPWSSLLFGDTLARQLAIYYDSNCQASQSILEKLRGTFLNWVRFTLKYCATGAEEYFTAFEPEKLPLSLRTKIRDRCGVFAGLEYRTDGEYAKAYQVNAKLDRTKIFQFLDPLDYAFCVEDSDDSQAPVYEMTEKELKGLEKAKTKEEKLQEKREREELRSGVHGMVLATMNPKRLKEEQERALRKSRKGQKSAKRKKGARPASAGGTGASVVPQITLSSLMGQGAPKSGSAGTGSTGGTGGSSRAVDDLQTAPASLPPSSSPHSVMGSVTDRTEHTDAPSVPTTRSVNFRGLSETGDSVPEASGTDSPATPASRESQRRRAQVEPLETGDPWEKSQSSLLHVSRGNVPEDTEDTDKAFLGGKSAPSGPVGGVRFQLDMAKVQRG